MGCATRRYSMHAKMFRTGLCALVFFIPFTLLGNIPVDLNTDATGVRSIPDANGIHATENWLTDGFTLSWEITQNNGNFHYVYNISGTEGGHLSKELSHIILELSPNINEENFANLIKNLTLTGATIKEVTDPKLYTPSDPGNSNPGLPGNVYGFKIDFDDDEQTFPIKIEFDSTRIPVWGDFYVKDGKNGGNDVYAYNVGLGSDPTLLTQDFTNWIPTPDTQDVPIPEPSTYILLSFILMGLGAIQYRRKSVA